MHASVVLIDKSCRAVTCWPYCPTMRSLMKDVQRSSAFLHAYVLLM